MWDGNESAYAGTTGEQIDRSAGGGGSPALSASPAPAPVSPAMDMSQHVPFRPTPESDGSPLLPPPELTPPQRLAVAALISGRTFSAAAGQAGVDRRTLHRWRQQPLFAQTVNDLSREALEATAARARSLMLKSMRTLGEVLCSGGDEYRAAWALRLANSRRMWELASILPEPAAADAADAATPGRAGADAV